jgi:hypothetical protein
MEQELCGKCTGSYTGEFDPKWRGPWAQFFDATGKFLESGGHRNAESQARMQAREDRFNALRRQNRLPMGATFAV